MLSKKERAHNDSISSVCHDSLGLISVSLDGVCKFWISSTEASESVDHSISCQLSFVAHQADIYCVKSNVEMDIMVTGSFDKTCKIWSRASGTLQTTLEKHADTVCCVDFNEKYLFTGSLDKTVRVWDIKTKECLKSFSTSAWVKCLQLSVDPVNTMKGSSHTLVVGCWDGSIQVWNVESGKRWIKINAHKGPVTSLQFDEKKIVSCSKDTEVKIFDFSHNIDDWTFSAFSTWFQEHRANLWVRPL